MSGIRIIAGEARGRTIKSFKNESFVRPILARTKKSLFDILQTRIAQASFLDLYSGTGAVGIEAISRGAALSVFIDQDKRCISLIKENLKLLSFESRGIVYQANIQNGLPWVKEKFDLIYLGPPYKDVQKKPLALTTPTLELINKAKLLKQDAWIIGQHHKHEHVDVPNGFVVFREEKYGDTVLTFIKNIAVGA